MDFKTVNKKLNSRNDEEVCNGLRTILNQCTQLRRNGGDLSQEDSLLKQYVEASPSSTELFQIWDDYRGDYDSPVLQADFEMMGEVLHFVDEAKRKEMCLTIHKKDRSELIGAILSENQNAINSVCMLLKSIADVGPAAVQLFAPKVPIASIRKLPSMMTARKTRYRVVRWILSLIREDPEGTGKQIMLRPDIMSALTEGLYQDGDFLMREIIALFLKVVLPSHAVSTKLKQSFFPWNTLSTYVETAKQPSTPPKQDFTRFILHLFSSAPTALYGPLPCLTFTSHVPTMVYRVLFQLNPFKSSFDRDLYLTILRSHPEVIPLLFADPRSLATMTSDSFVIGGSAIETGKTKALINWLLEPRASSLWLNTVDFLLQVLQLPLVLPTDAPSLATSSPETVLEAIKPWLWPMVLTRSMLMKGLTLPNKEIVEKTLLLLTHMVTRLQAILSIIYPTPSAAIPLLNHLQGIFPSSDMISNLLKKVLTCLLDKEPFEGRKVSKSVDGEPQPVVHLVSKKETDMEVEEEEEEEEEMGVHGEGEKEVVESPMESLERLLQELCSLLRLQKSLFPTMVAQVKIDLPTVLSLLFAADGENSSTVLLALLDLLQLMVDAQNASVLQALVTVRGDQKPLLLLLQKATHATTLPTLRRALETLLVSILQNCQAGVGLDHLALFVKIVLPVLTPTSCIFFHDVVQDLRNQRIRFLARTHKYGFSAPLMAHALLYAAMRPRSADSVWVCFLGLQLLLLSNPIALTATLQLLQQTLEEVAKEEKSPLDKESLVSGPVTDDLAGAMRAVITYWECCPSGKRMLGARMGEVTLDAAHLQKMMMMQEETMDEGFLQVFHALLWSDLESESLLALVNTSQRQSNALFSLLLLAPVQMAGTTVEQSWSTLLSTPSLDDRCRTSPTLSLAVLFMHMRVALFSSTALLETLQQNEVLPVEAYAVMSYWTARESISTVMDERETWLRWLLSHARDEDVETVLHLLQTDCSAFWSTPASAACCLTVIQRVTSMLEEKQQRRSARMVISLLLTQLELPYAVAALVDLQHFLDATEKETLLQYMLPRLADTAFTTPLLQRSATLIAPLNAHLLQPLFGWLDKTVLAARLLHASYEQLLAVGTDLASVEAQTAISLIDQTVIETCVQHLPAEEYTRLLVLLLRLQPSLQSVFLHALFQPSMDGVYFQQFISLVPLIFACLTHPAAPKEALLAALRESTFYIDLLQRGCRSEVSTTMRDCILLLLREDPSFGTAVSTLDLLQLCKTEYDSATATAAQFNLLLTLCTLQGEHGLPAVRTLLLRTLQALGKRWSKEGVYIPSTGPAGSTDRMGKEEQAAAMMEGSEGLVEALLKACEIHQDVLAQVAAKQGPTLVRLAKLLLKNRLLEANALVLLRLLLTALEASGNEELTGRKALHLMATHSSYGQLLASVREQCVAADDDALRTRWMHQRTFSSELAEQFLLLHQSILERDPQACTTALFYQLLSLYACSFSRTDQILRGLFVTLHRAGAQSLEKVGFLIGRFAPLNATSCVQVPSTWLLEAISGLRLRKSVESFPQEEEDDDDDENNENENDGNDENDDMEEEEEEGEERETNAMEVEGEEGKRTEKAMRDRVLNAFRKMRAVGMEGNGNEEDEEDMQAGYLEELRERRQSVDNTFPTAMEMEMEMEEEEEKEENNGEDNEEEKQHDDDHHQQQQQQGEEGFDPNFDCIEWLLFQPPRLQVAPRDALLLVDPTFFLPALHYWLHAATIDVRAYVAHGVAGYLLACMTSTCKAIRQCASCLLQRLYECVQDATFFEQPQVQLVLMKLQNSIPSPTTRLSSIMASFVAEALGIMLRPAHPLYSSINRFFLSHATFQLVDTPLFHQLFLSESEQYKPLRAWCLRYLLRGLQTDQDYTVLARRHVLSQLQAFAISRSCDVYTQKLCVAAVQRLAHIPTTANLLYRNVGVLPWLVTVAQQAKSRSVVYAAVDVLEQIAHVEGEDEILLQSNCLQCLHQLVEMMMMMMDMTMTTMTTTMTTTTTTTEDFHQGDVNHLLLPCIRVYDHLCGRFKEYEGEDEVMVMEVKTQFFRVWCVLLQCVKNVQGVKEYKTSEFLEGCDLSNDDFYMLCDPEVRSVEACLKDVLELLQKMKYQLPFGSDAFRSQENLFESLFI